MGTEACRFGIERTRWDLPFPAEAERLAELRRLMRFRLELWGLDAVVHAAQVCVTELVGNVIKHMGAGTPTSLGVLMNGGLLRIEVTDPGGKALPALVRATDEMQQGRGMCLVNGIADRWGVVLRGNSKVTWCEIATGLRSSGDHVDGPQVQKAEALLGLCGIGVRPRASRPGRLSLADAEEVAIDLIADLLHWLKAHGLDPDGALDRAQSYVDSELQPAG
ncbi:ATP-binding protein [Streptomyces sp. NPDC057429]|uniref:ATP-binding protein n=1 Tax=Streptomyces sp. NPDC057429 TaxID=3346130 RepID=UPI0036A8FD14